MIEDILSENGKDLIRSPDFKLGIALGALCSLVLLLIDSRFKFVAELCVVYMGVLGTLFSVVIAALAIYLSVSDAKYLLYLRRQNNALDSFLFAFKATAQISLIGLLVAAMTFVASYISALHSLNLYAKIAGVFPANFFFTYSIASCYLLVQTVVRSTDQKLEFQEIFGDQELNHVRTRQSRAGLP